MIDDAYYDNVAREIQAQKMVPGLWTKAFAEADGQLDRARALYIKLRVAQLAQEASEHLQREQKSKAQQLWRDQEEAREKQIASRQAAREACKRKIIDGIGKSVMGLLVIISGLITACLAAGGCMFLFAKPSEPIVTLVLIVVAVLFGFITRWFAKETLK